MGGGKPLVINGLPYGDTNRFGTGTPKSFPTTGYPGPAGAGLLSSSATQAFCGAERQRNTILRVVPGGAAAERDQNLLVLMMHEHGADPGISLAGMRDPLVAIGASNALAFDGLGDATLVRDSTVVAAPGGGKNQTIPVGRRFKPEARRRLGGEGFVVVSSRGVAILVLYAGHVALVVMLGERGLGSHDVISACKRPDRPSRRSRTDRRRIRFSGQSRFTGNLFSFPWLFHKGHRGAYAPL